MKYAETLTVTMLALAMAPALALGGCGTAGKLMPAPGTTLPVAAYGDTTRPSAETLLTASTQQRPDRADELLKHSTERRSDEFDLPPPR